MNIQKANQLLDPLIKLIQRLEPNEYSHFVENELNEKGTEAFLISNTLWGGSGSVADQVGISEGKEERRKVEDTLITLGEFQISEDHLNPRTKSWIEAYKNWKNNGI